MTEIENAAYALMKFLRKNCAPDDIPESVEDEWPVSILVDNDADAEEMDRLFTELEDHFEEAGRPVR